MVGLIDDERHITTQWFKQTGDAVILVNSAAAVDDPGLGASRFLKVCHGLKQGPVPTIDLTQEIAVQNAVRNLILAGLVKSAHDCSEGGIAVALAECCFSPNGQVGAEINLDACSRRPQGDAEDSSRAAAVLFNESQSRIVLSVAPGDAEKAVETLRSADVSASQIGWVGGTDLIIRAHNEVFRWPVAELHDPWWNAIQRAIESDSSAERLPSL